MFRVFYCRYDIDLHQQEPIAIHRSEILQLASHILRKPEDFFGIVDDHDTTVQFMVEEQGIWTEIPDPSRGGSFGAYLSPEEAFDLIRAIQTPIKLGCIKNGTFESW